MSNTHVFSRCFASKGDVSTAMVNPAESNPAGSPDGLGPIAEPRRLDVHYEETQEATNSTTTLEHTRIKRQWWTSYRILLPFSFVVGELAWVLRKPLEKVGQIAWHASISWIGPYLLAPFVLVMLFLLVAIVGLLKRRQGRTRRVRLTPAAIIEFLVTILPSLGFLGTVLGMSAFIGRLDSSVFRGLDAALGTTAVALTMVVIAQFLRVLLDDGYRTTLNEEAGYTSAHGAERDES